VVEHPDASDSLRDFIATVAEVARLEQSGS
jgi:hypothetical protein